LLKVVQKCINVSVGFIAIILYLFIPFVHLFLFITWTCFKFTFTP